MARFSLWPIAATVAWREDGELSDSRRSPEREASEWSDAEAARGRSTIGEFCSPKRPLDSDRFGEAPVRRDGSAEDSVDVAIARAAESFESDHAAGIPQETSRKCLTALTTCGLIRRHHDVVTADAAPHLPRNRFDRRRYPRRGKRCRRPRAVVAARPAGRCPGTDSPHRGNLTRRAENNAEVEAPEKSGAFRVSGLEI